MSCPCQSRAIAGYDDASKTYKPPFPGAWFWTYSWPTSAAEVPSFPTVDVGGRTVPSMVITPGAGKTPEQVRVAWETQCKAGTFPGGMRWNCESAKHRPSMAGYAAIGGGVLVLAGLAYLALKA